MTTRRTFLGLAAGASAAAFRDDGLERVLAAGRGAQARSAETVAQDEDYWREIQQAFTVNRSYVNLNNGGVCPSPRVVQEAMKRYLDLSNEAPVYTMWQLLEPQIESVRRDLARDVRLRPRGDGDHPQRQRGARDRAARPRPEAGRRDPHHDPRLRPRCSPPGTSASGATGSC